MRPFGVRLGLRRPLGFADYLSEFVANQL